MAEPQYELVMPFIAVTSKGGPYDDDAFAAGYQAGWLDHILQSAANTDTTLRVTVPPPLVGQLDLVAMRHGFKLTSEPWDERPDEWALVTFTAVDEAAC